MEENIITAKYVLPNSSITDCIPINSVIADCILPNSIIAEHVQPFNYFIDPISTQEIQHINSLTNELDMERNGVEFRTNSLVRNGEELFIPVIINDIENATNNRIEILAYNTRAQCNMYVVSFIIIILLFLLVFGIYAHLL